MGGSVSSVAVGSEVGGFRIERELGRGGMGVVFLAEQVNLRRKVALKVIAPHLSGDPDFTARFEREARLAASLDHPNVIPIFETGSVEDLLYLAMRYVPGADLGAVLASQGALEPERAANIAGQLGAALDAAHANGLIHRDVKPGNVLLANSDPDGHIYLTDFGLTKEASGGQSAQITGTGQWVGTVDYIAPEQLDRRPIDARTDVYSLGCVLYQLLSGHVPYEGTSLQKMFSHGSSAPPSLEAFDPELAARFDPVIARAMAKDPDERYPSAGDLGRGALAASTGTQVRVPERSVAAGAAAEGESDSEIATQIVGATSSANTRTEPRSGPRAKRAVPPPIAPAPAPTTAGATPPPTRKRGSRLLIPAAVIAAVLLAASVGAFLASRGNDDDPVPAKRAGAGTETPRAQDAEGKAAPSRAGSKRDRGRATRAPKPAAEPVPAPTAVAFREYTPSSSGYSTRIPTGAGWSEPSETEPTPGQLYRTTINGPGGLVVVIDYTPLEPARFGGGADAVREVGQAAFGSATEYTFSGGNIPQCANSQCVDYIVNDGSRGSGYGILAGGGTDFGLAKRVALQITESLVYSDI